MALQKPLSGRDPDELMRSILPGCKPENNVYCPSIESHEGVSDNHKKRDLKRKDAGISPGIFDC
jgi:hypothetical protein